MNLDNSFKKQAIHQEIEASFEYIRVGLLNLREQNSAVSNNHVTLQLLASGFERILKVLLLIKFKHLNGKFPELEKCKKHFMVYNNGHGIEKMLNELVEYSTSMNGFYTIPMIKEDINFLKDDNHFKSFIEIITQFAISGRYFYIDTLVQGGLNNSTNYFDEFKYFIGSQNQNVNEQLHSYQEEETIKINNTIICIEKGARALSRFFSHGFDGLGKEYFAGIIDFLLLKDEDLGKLNYSKTFSPIDTYRPLDADSPSFQEIAKKNFSKTLEVRNYNDWPFLLDSLIVYNIEERYFLVKIDNKIYGLTGKSSTYYKVPFYTKSEKIKPREKAPFLLEEAKNLGKKPFE